MTRPRQRQCLTRSPFLLRRPPPAKTQPPQSEARQHGCHSGRCTAWWSHRSWTELLLGHRHHQQQYACSSLGESSVILLHPRLPLAGVSRWMETGVSVQCTAFAVQQHATPLSLPLPCNNTHLLSRPRKDRNVVATADRQGQCLSREGQLSHGAEAVS